MPALHHDALPIDGSSKHVFKKTLSISSAEPLGSIHVLEDASGEGCQELRPPGRFLEVRLS